MTATSRRGTRVPFMPPWNVQLNLIGWSPTLTLCGSTSDQTGVFDKVLDDPFLHGICLAIVGPWALG